ncbi:MAG TPA: hypothetical protein VK610_03485 [Rhodothermales bacterium]|nr:hypothetical protein [Rhodothermales bacterium]
MGYTIRVLPEYQLGVVTLTGHVGGSELLRAMRALAFHPNWEPGFQTAWDARYLRVIDLVPADIPAFTAVTRELAHRMGAGRSAVLTRSTDDEITVRLLSLRGRGRFGHALRAFLSWTEAVRWLGVPAHTLDRRLDWRPWHDLAPSSAARGLALGWGVRPVAEA